MIPNITREDIVEAGKYFNQESVIWGKKDADEKFIFEYIEGDDTIQRRNVALFGDEVQAREDFFSQERQSAARKFFIPFFDEQYEMEEGQESEYDLPALSEKQFDKLFEVKKAKDFHIPPLDYKWWKEERTNLDLEK